MRPQFPEGRIDWRNALSSLRHDQYRWLFGSNTGFFFGMNGQMIVRSWLAYQLTDSALALGLVSFAVAVPMILVAPLGGVLADRVERRNLVAAGQATLVLGELTVLVLLVTGLLRFWHLLSLAGIMGCVFPFIMPARQALVVSVVGKRELTNAMALSMAGMNASRVLAPSLAGLLIWLVGLEITYCWGILLYAAALFCLLRVDRSPPAVREIRHSVAHDMFEGIRYMQSKPVVGILLLFGLLPMFLAMPFQTLLPIFSRDIWHVGSQGYGFLNGAGGVGGLVGSIYVAVRAGESKRLGPMMLSVLLFCVFLVGFALSPWYWLGLPLVLVANVFSSVFGTLNNTAVQLLIPDHVRGRISSFLMMSFGLPLLGTLPMSAIAEGYGAPAAVTVAALLAALTALLFYVASASLRNLDASVEAELEIPRVPTALPQEIAPDAVTGNGPTPEPARAPVHPG